MIEVLSKFDGWRAIVNSEADSRLILEKLLVFFILTISPALWVLISCYHELNFYSFSYLIFGFLFNAISQLVLVRFLFRVDSLLFRSAVVLFLFVILLVNFIFNVIYLVSFTATQKILVSFVFLLISVISILAKNGLRFSLFFSFFLLLQPLVYLVLSFDDISYGGNYDIKSSRMSGDFVKRNIYFIGLDSLAGDEYYKRYFDSDPFWSKEFEDIGFRKFNNVHTGGANSTRSFYLNLLSFKNNSDYLRNRNLLNKPLKFYKIVKEHGYNSQFMFHSYLLGSGRNKFFDYNYPLNEQGNATCPFLTPNIGFYLCQEKVVRVVESFFQSIFAEKFDLSASVDDSIENMMPVLFDRIKLAANDQSPWVSIFHLWEPGHTLGDYRHYNEKQKNEFRYIFHQRALNATRDAMSIVAEIKKYDRDPIIIISGDHGPYLSQGWETDSSINQMFSPNERYEDTQGIGFFIYPKSFCSNRIKDGYVGYFLFNDIFYCLNSEKKVN